VELAQLEAATRIEVHRPDATGPADAAGRAFASLELAPDASDREIKKAYRRLMNRYHPDKLAGSDASEEAMADAARKTREVREAYELLRQRRGFR
jgi:DnaJ like chaperone protein